MDKNKSTVLDGTFKKVGGTDLLIRSGVVPQWCKKETSSVQVLAFIFLINSVSMSRR